MNSQFSQQVKEAISKLERQEAETALILIDEALGKMGELLDTVRASFEVTKLIEALPIPNISFAQLHQKHYQLLTECTAMLRHLQTQKNLVEGEQRLVDIKVRAAEGSSS